MAFTTELIAVDDITSYYEVQNAAFDHARRIFKDPYPLSEGSKAIDFERFIRTFRKRDALNSVSVFKAVDQASGKMIAASEWSVYEEDQLVENTLEEEVVKALQNILPETRVDVFRGFVEMKAKARREILAMGGADALGPIKLRRRIDLDTIFTHPDYQGRGIASGLQQWGFREAERLGLDIYLGATAEGRPLYEKNGFETGQRD